MESLTGRPSPATVMSALALFVSLGGVGYAAATIDSADIANNSVRGKDIRNGTIRSKDVGRNSLGGGAIAESSLGRVPEAARADAATSAISAATATNATSAGNADMLDGVDSAGFLSSTALTPPPLQALPLPAGWSTFGDSPASAWKDATGTVHLQGQVGIDTPPAANGELVATLPVGLRPDRGFTVLAVVVASGAPGVIDILTDGRIQINNPLSQPDFGDFVSLDSISFRPAP